MMKHRSIRKRPLTSDVTLQTNYTDSHRTYFRLMEAGFDNFAEKAKVFENFFCFDFFEGVNVRYFELPIRLDLTTWSKDLIEKHIGVTQGIEEKTEHMNATEKFLSDFLSCENSFTQQICETDNLVYGGSSVETLCERDDLNNKLKHEDLAKISSINTWFIENKEAENYEKMQMFVSYLIYKKNICAYTESSEKISRAIGERESNDIVGRVKDLLLKDPETFAAMYFRGSNFFDLLRDEIIGRTDIHAVLPQQVISSTSSFSDSYFRRVRALWGTANGTPGFEGSTCPTKDNFHKLCKVFLMTKGDYAGYLIDDLENVTKNSPGVQEIDIFCVDENISSKLKAYLEDEKDPPSFQAWKNFVKDRYIPGSAVFFHPTIVGSPVETSKPAYLAFINRKPAHCFDRNAITEQGLNMSFFILSWSEVDKEWYLGSQEKLDSKNSTQRRRILLEKNQAVLATQLPGKKNVDTNYVNELYYGAPMKNAEVDDGKLFD